MSHTWISARSSGAYRCRLHLRREAERCTWSLAWSFAPPINVRHSSCRFQFATYSTYSGKDRSDAAGTEGLQQGWRLSGSSAFGRWRCGGGEGFGLNCGVHRKYYYLTKLSVKLLSGT